MNLGILVIATGKYDVFIPPLWDSVRKWVLPDSKHTVTMCVHAGATRDRNAVGNHALEWYHQDHLGWPGATLYRYHVFLRTARQWRSRFDYLLYLDADMRIVDKIGEEIFSDVLAVQHPGFWRENHAPYPHENRACSRAYVPHALRKTYYCGGVQGGSIGDFLFAMQRMRGAIDEDFDNGVVATWHDESHWNHFLTMYRPPTKVLGPEYCVPEEFSATWPVPQKILALKKDHAKFQGGKP